MDLAVIKNENQYVKSLQLAEQLVALDPIKGTGDAEKLELLALLISDYESKISKLELPSGIDAIKFRMDGRNLKQRDLIPYIGNRSKVSEVLSGKRPLTITMIRNLSEALSIPADILVRESKSECDLDEEDLKKLPYIEMEKKGWFSEINIPQTNRIEVLKTFLSPLNWDGDSPILCRSTHSRAGTQINRYALTAWSAKVLLLAQSMGIASYRPINEDLIKEVIALSPSNDGPIKAREFLASNGIALVILPHLKKTKLDGAVMMSQYGNPVIGMTLRYDRLDNFWFTLIHELIHVWKHLNNNSVYIDDLDTSDNEDPKEIEADNLAEEFLVPKKMWKSSNAFTHRTASSIIDFSYGLNVHPAIVAGKIRNETKNYKILNHMLGRGMVRSLFNDVNWQ